MFDETNQTDITEEIAMPETLFDDDNDDAFTEDSQDSHANDEVRKENTNDGSDDDTPAADDDDSAASDDDKPASDATIRVKYNGEEREISLDEAIVLAQKGMNYDHVLAERDTKYNREVSILDRFAKSSNMTREEYIAFLEKSEAHAVEQNELLQLSEQYPDAPHEVLERLAEVEAQKQRDDAQRRDDEARTQPWNAFFNAYPDVNPTDIAPEVYTAIEGGASPIVAYQSHLINTLNERLAIAEKTADVRNRSVGSARGEAYEKQHDSFLDGFNSI